jgi:hypothetical protein
MGKYDSQLRKIREVHANLVEGLAEKHKIEARFSDMTTQITSLTRMKKDVDARITAALKLLVNPKSSTASCVPAAADLHKFLQQRLKVEEGMALIGPQEMVNRVAQDGLRMVGQRLTSWVDTMNQLVHTVQDILVKEEEKSLREAMRKIDWKKVGVVYVEPRLRK